MTASTNHVTQNAKLVSADILPQSKIAQQIFCLRRQNKQVCQLFSGLVWNKIYVFGPWAVNGLDVTGYGQSRPEKYWTCHL